MIIVHPSFPLGNSRIIFDHFSWLMPRTISCRYFCKDIPINEDLFGYISSIDSNRIHQILIDNSKITHSSDLDIHSTEISFVLRVQSWPKEIRSIYEQRHRFWPIATDLSSLFQSTCFIRSNGNEYQTLIKESCSHCEQILSICSSSWSYTYSAIENELVKLMTDGQKRFASINWNYLNKKSEGQFPFILFKHTLFFFFEQYPSDQFTRNDLTKTYLDYFLDCFQKKSIPHYFNSILNLFNENISIEWLSTPFLSGHSLIYILPDSAMYLSSLQYLIEFQSKFLDHFPSGKSNITQTILETDQYVRKRLSIPDPLTLDCLYQYQQSNVQIIVEYLPVLRLEESSLLLHAFWSIFIQYFHRLFDDQFKSSSSISESSSR